MSEWKEVKLGDVLVKITKGTTPPRGKGFVEDGINYIKSDAIGYDGRIDDSLFVSIDEETHEKFKRSQLEKDDILFSMAGVFLGKNAIVKEEHLPANTNQALAIIRLNQDLAKPQFVSYYLRQPAVIEYVNNMSGQSAQPNINFQEISSIEIPLPNIEEQQNVIEVLSSLDDKIDLLHRQNQTLENLGQALLTKCFENVKEEENSLSDYFELLGGFAFKSKTYVDDGAYKVLTIKAVQDGYLETGNAATIIDLPEKLKEFQKLSIGDILMSLTGNVGRVCLVDETNCLLNQRVALVKPIEHALKSFAYFFFRQPEMITRLTYLSKGSAQLNLSPVETLNERDFFPKDESLNQFRNLADPILEKIISNKLSIHKVKALRDTLLPKLMSGEIRIDTDE